MHASPIPHVSRIFEPCPNKAPSTLQPYNCSKLVWRSASNNLVRLLSAIAHRSPARNLAEVQTNTTRRWVESRRKEVGLIRAKIQLCVVQMVRRAFLERVEAWTGSKIKNSEWTLL
jgi:hypothetical protein